MRAPPPRATQETALTLTNITREGKYIDTVIEDGGMRSLRTLVKVREKIQKRNVSAKNSSHAAAEAEALDALLWSFRDTSFVPHRLLDAGGDAPVPVLVGSGEDASDHHDVLLNLADSVPPLFSRFERVAEIVLNDAQSLASSRKRWSFYKDRGYPLQHHDMQHLRSTRGGTES